MRVALAATVSLCLAASTAAAEPAQIVFSPQAPTDSQVVRAIVSGDGDRACGAIFYAQVDAAARRVDLTGYGADPPPGGCPIPRWSSEATIGFLASGPWAVSATLDASPFASAELTVSSSPTRVSLGSFGYFATHFDVEVEWRDPRNGEPRRAPGAAISDRAAQFWFFDPGLPEVTVKILDGTAVNGHHWLFTSSMTGVEFTLLVTACVEGDPPFCAATREVHSAARANLDLVDVEFYP